MTEYTKTNDPWGRQRLLSGDLDTIEEGIKNNANNIVQYGSGEPSTVTTVDEDNCFYIDTANNDVWRYDGTTWVQVTFANSSIDKSYITLTGGNAIDTIGTINLGETASIDVSANGIGSTEIDDYAVGALQLASDSVTNAKIVDFAVGQQKLSSDSVSTAKIQTDAVGTDEINQTITPTWTGLHTFSGKINATSDIVGGAGADDVTIYDHTNQYVPINTLQHNSITLTGGNAIDDTIGSVSLGGSGTINVTTGGINTTELADNAVETVKINNGAVVANKADLAAGLENNGTGGIQVNGGQVAGTYLSEGANGYDIDVNIGSGLTGDGDNITLSSHGNSFHSPDMVEDVGSHTDNTTELVTGSSKNQVHWRYYSQTGKYQVEYRVSNTAYNGGDVRFYTDMGTGGSTWTMLFENGYGLTGTYTEDVYLGISDGSSTPQCYIEIEASGINETDAIEIDKSIVKKVNDVLTSK